MYLFNFAIDEHILTLEYDRYTVISYITALELEVCAGLKFVSKHLIRSPIPRPMCFFINLSHYFAQSQPLPGHTFVSRTAQKEKPVQHVSLPHILDFRRAFFHKLNLLKARSQLSTLIV